MNRKDRIKNIFKIGLLYGAIAIVLTGCSSCWPMCIQKHCLYNNRLYETLNQISDSLLLLNFVSDGRTTKRSRSQQIKNSILFSILKFTVRKKSHAEDEMFQTNVLQHCFNQCYAVFLQSTRPNPLSSRKYSKQLCSKSDKVLD